MANEKNENHHLKFIQHFPGFNGGIRELRYIVAMLNINSDTYQNSEYEIKRYISSCFPLIGASDKINKINKYLVEAKVSIDYFEFMDESRSQICLIENEIAKFLLNREADSHTVEWLNSLPFRIKEKFIFLIDLWIENFMNKEGYVLSVATRFSRVAIDMKYLEWFDNDAEKVVAADDYFRKKHLFPLVVFKDVEDIKSYFYKNHENKDGLRLNFGEIRSLYNNRKSRKNTNAKQCNFSLSSSADKNIGKLAKDNGLTRSEVIDIFFKDINKLRKFYGGKVLPEELTFPSYNLTPTSGDLTPAFGDLTPVIGDLTPVIGDPTPVSGEIIRPPRPIIDTSGIHFED